MKKIISILLTILIFCTCVLHIYARDDEPYDSGTVSGYGWAAFIIPYGVHQFHAMFEVAGENVNIVLQGVVSYTDGSYDLNFDYGYSEPGSLYTEVEAFYVLAEGKTATRIDFDGHIYVNGIYVDTFGMVVYY